MTVLLHKHSPIGKAHTVYREFTADRELMDIAEAKEKWRRDVDSRLHAARTEGRTEGRTETRFDVARGMLNEGLEIDMIRRITELSDEEIQALRDKTE